MVKDDNYTNVLLEDIRSQMQAVLEISRDTQRKVEPLATIQEDISELKSDFKTIKLVVTDTNKDLRLLDRRITHLEQKIA
jgi:capsule polysaccharide export protein KpsE/RkpR